VIISQTTESFSRISEIITRGGVIGFRTDTFYGLGADPFNRKAVQRIKQLKGREENQPILIVISEWQTVGRFIAEPTPAFHRLAKTFWPGPLTLVGCAGSKVPEEITAGTKTVGVRLPGDDRVRALVEACGGALTATSANPSREKPATTAQKVFDVFADAIDLIVDDGNAMTDQPSTVVDVCDVAPRLIREGAIAWSAVQKVLNKNTFKSS
jgi:L-threonylcarbamoyladenylate synthase